MEAAVMILGIVQARISSTRFPAKVIQPILGQPMLLKQLERIQHSKTINKIIVATSTEATDDLIEHLCQSNKIECFRGNLNDVLDRYYQAATRYQPDHIVRLTGDCPLTDPHIIDQVINHHLNGHYDYTSNTLDPTFPDGLDVEVMTYASLKQAWQHAVLPSYREHVTRFFYTQPTQFKLGTVKNDTNLSHLRWTVDEPIDFELIDHIYQSLYIKNPNFNFSDIMTYLNENPALQKLNANIPRNIGMQTSLLADQQFVQGQET
jgi:spore coat polysaccharide biosynthesis protein SpsF